MSCSSCLVPDSCFGTDELWATAARLHDTFEKESNSDCLEECIILYGRLLEDDGTVVRAFLLGHHDELTRHSHRPGAIASWLGYA
jgi:hypothetical protein